MESVVHSDKHLDLIKKTDRIFIERIPFNKLVGMKVDDYGEHPLNLRIDIRQELVGNFERNMLHGGVTLSVLDAVGGMHVFREVIKRHDDQSDTELMQILTKISTISLNTQFLRPGIGNSFYATAEVQRMGSKVAFVDMQMKNENHVLIATGNGIYSVS